MRRARTRSRLGRTWSSTTWAYTALGQLAFLDRPASTLDTVLDYHGQTDNYRLAAVRHGTADDALPDYGYTGYDAAGNLTGMTMRTGSTTETFAFGYDDLNRLTSASLTNAGMANFSYTYAYSELGNITSRTGTAPALTYQYGDSLHKQAVTQAAGGGTTYAYTYGTRGNLLTPMVNGVTSTYDFDVQGRLTSISGAVTAGFAYDPDGNRVKAVYGNRTVYTPFPDYEVTDNGSDGTLDETRTTYRLAGRIIAVRGAAGNIRHVAFDHLGSVGALFDASTLVSGSLTRFDPFGNFRGTPPTTNPGTTDHGYTGHRHNNTGTPDLGLIYMNARYYLPEVGRFISPDTIVPEPGNPQSYNRYSYTRNNPLNFMDPTGQKECIDPDANGCKVTLPHEPSPPAPPPFIPAVPPFGSLPFDPSQVGSNSMQGFGDTTYAYDNRDSMYSYLGRLHGGWDIPLSSGTSLFSLGLGTVVCVGESCGLAAASGNGLGIAIRYDSCNCVVFYTHLATINEGLTVDSSVVRGIEIGTSGTDVTGYPHLHLEIRPKHDVLTFYNPLYFFSRQALRLIPNDFMAYEGASNEWRIYGYTSSLDHRFIGSFWDKTLPALWVRR